MTASPFRKQLTRNQLNQLAIEGIPARNHSLFGKESALYPIKWWDYRLMHPSEATMAFCEEYKAARRHAMRLSTDYEEIEEFSGLGHPDLFCNKPVIITGMWKARQMADSLGMHYRFYCYRAFEYATVRKWERLPTPNQMYVAKPHASAPDDISMIEFITQRWAEHTRTRSPAPQNPFYSTEHYQGHDYQREYQRTLLARIQSHPRTVEALADAVFDRQQLLPQLAEKVMGRVKMDKARQLSSCD